MLDTPVIQKVVEDHMADVSSPKLHAGYNVSPGEARTDQGGEVPTQGVTDLLSA